MVWIYKKQLIFLEAFLNLDSKEEGYSETVAKELIKGHRITRPDQPIGGTSHYF